MYTENRAKKIFKRGKKSKHTHIVQSKYNTRKKDEEK